MIKCFVIIIQIKLSEIDFWMEHSTLDTMLRKHKYKMYPPKVKMTITRKSNDVTKLPIKITGCLDEGLMDMDIPLQLGKHLFSIVYSEVNYYNSHLLETSAHAGAYLRGFLVARKPPLCPGFHYKPIY